MTAGNKTFATAFNCMDGRCQEAVTNYARKKFSVEFVDMITEPGMDGILVGKKVAPEQPGNIFDWIIFKAKVSTGGHGSRHAVVVGHSQCAGNNVSDQTHLSDIQQMAETVRSWKLFETVIPLMAREGSNGWEVSEVSEVQTAAAA